MYILSNCKRCTKNRQIVPKNTKAAQESSCTALVSKEKRSMDEKTWGHVLVPGPCSLPENIYSIPEQAAWQVFGAYFFVWLYSFFTVPFIWLGLMIYSLVKLPQKRREAVARATTYGAFWYHPVYDRLPEESPNPNSADAS